MSTSQQHMIHLEIQGFLLDRKARGLSENTILYYQRQLDHLVKLCQCNSIEEISTNSIREGLIKHGHAWFRAVKAFMLWYEMESDGEYHSPIRKIHPPRVRHDPLPGVSQTDIGLLLATCDKTRYGVRNRAIILLLYDTGVRVSELCALNIGDINYKTGEVTVRHGKGDKPRTAFIGITTRRELLRYLRFREDNPDAPLFIGKDSKQRMVRRGVATMLERVALKAGIPAPRPHDFRRAFTKSSLKRADVVSVARMLGHSDTQLVWRYYHQDIDDLRKVHEISSPVDNMQTPR